MAPMSQLHEPVEQLSQQRMTTTDTDLCWGWLGIVGRILKPDTSWPQSVLQAMEHASERVLLSQQSELTQYVLVNCTACYQRQYLAGHPKHLHVTQ